MLLVTPKTTLMTSIIFRYQTQDFTQHAYAIMLTIVGNKEFVVKGSAEEHRDLQPEQEVWLRFKRGNIYNADSRKLLDSFGFNSKT